MLARRRGTQRGRGKRMTKKGGPAALQTEVINDDEWEKILERSGLILVDVYSEWSGPCAGMVSILKKIKMEIGGDSLSYATARCDNITSLARFRGKSEPTWMFIRAGMMINLLFGANSPELSETLTKELKKLHNNEEPDFSIPVSEMCEVEIERLRIIEEARQAKEAEMIAKIEAKAKAKYEAMLAHYVDSLKSETLLILFPWIFKDDEGNSRDKRSSPPYVELIDQTLPGNFVVEQELKKKLNDNDIVELQRETDFQLCDFTKQQITNGKCLCLRLRDTSGSASDDELNANLCDLLFDEPRVPFSPDVVIEGSFLHRHTPTGRNFNNLEAESVSSMHEALMTLTTVWIPLNTRNKALAFKQIFAKYVDSTYPYQEIDEDFLRIVFKFDSTKKKELQVVLNSYEKDVVSFGVFERDTLPNPKFITKHLDKFENEYKDKTGYEAFVAVVRKENSEAFLSFAGLGPYHVSESPEVAIEEAEQYFPKNSVEEEEAMSDDDRDGDENEHEGYEDYDADQNVGNGHTNT